MPPIPKDLITYVFVKLLIKYTSITDKNSVISNIRALQKHAREFEDLADMCLLVLHLEVRVHCFYYLLPVAKQVLKKTEMTMFRCFLMVFAFLGIFCKWCRQPRSRS